MDKDIHSYIFEKIAYYIIFNFDNKNYHERRYLFDIKLMNYLKEKIDFHVSKNDFTKKVRENILDYLNQARFIEDEFKLERIEIINDIIRTLNTQQKDYSSIFYSLELFKRTRQPKYLLKFNLEFTEEEMDIINQGIAFDLYVLCAVDKNSVSDEEFTESFLPTLIKNEFFYETINAILVEDPSLFKDRNIYDRVISIFNMNEMLMDDKDTKKMNKQFIKEMNRKIKR